MEEAASFSSSTLKLVITLASVYLIYSLLFRPRGPKRRLPPGPWALPVIGHLHLLGPPLHQNFHALAARYGPLVHLRLGSTRAVLASTPDVAKELLKTHDLAFAERAQSIAVLRFAYETAGFAFAPYGPYWKFMKRLCMSELLGGRTVEQLGPVRRRELLAFLRALARGAAARDPVNVSLELIKMTNNVITRMTASTTASDPEEARKLVKQVAELVGVFNVSDHISFCRNLDLQRLNRRIDDVHRRFDAMMEKIIREKEELRKTRRQRGEAAGGSGVRDLLDILLDVAEDENAEVKITRDNIKGFVLDVFTAGSDSSAATTEWALSELINHPEMLEKAREEIDQVVGKERLVEERDVPNLPYLQAVVKETLRLHPAAPLVIRQSTTDVQVGGYDIPAGTSLYVNLYSVGRDPGYWPEPLEFRPDRFLGDGGAAAALDVRGQHFQLLPFGSGRRVCPGISLAMQVVQVTLAALLQCFHWELGKLDMSEGIGMVPLRVNSLVCVPVPRLEPFPSLDLDL